MTESKDFQLETFALRLSVIGYACMALAGLVFAALTQSGAILLDGAYSLVSLVMALLAGQIVKLIEQPDSDFFHFGYAYFEPLLNTIRGLLILVVVVFGVGSAVLALFSGGRTLNPGLALAYSVIVGVICIGLSIIQRRHARLTDSPLLRTDARSWFVDGMLTIAVGVAFLGALVLARSPWAHWLPYVDPAIVIVLGLVMLPTPISIVLNNVGELLHAAPERSVQQDIRQRIEQATANLSLIRRDVRMVRVGRYFYVLIKLIVSDDFPRSAIQELDRIRDAIATELKGRHPQLVLDVVFTSDDRWILGLVDSQTAARQANDSSTNTTT